MTPQRLKEAESREGMRVLNVALPEKLHRALALVRVEDGIAMNESVRMAVTEWLANRRKARRKAKP